VFGVEVKSWQLSIERVKELHPPGNISCYLQSPAGVQNDATVLMQNLKDQNG
jgi:hypothetical protein